MKLDGVGVYVIEILSFRKVERFGELVCLNPFTMEFAEPLDFVDWEKDWNGARSLGPAVRGLKESAVGGRKLDCEALFGLGELVDGSARRTGPFGGFDGRRVPVEKGFPCFRRRHGLSLVIASGHRLRANK